MRWPLLRTITRRRSRNAGSLIVVVMIAVIVAAGLGVPLVPVVSKDKSRPFPCQDSACACRDADSCWRSCCCMNDEQKLAWAEQHGVEPPRYVVDRVRVARRAAKPSCASKSSDGCCHRSATPETRAASQATNDSQDALSFVLLSSQSRCQGLSSWFALMASALVEPPATVWAPDLGPAQLLPSFTARYEFTAQPPASPPPRLG